MSLFSTVRRSITRALDATSARSKCTPRFLKHTIRPAPSLERFASGSPKPPTPPKGHAPPPKRNVELPVQKLPVDPSRKAALLLNRLSNAGQKDEKPLPNKSSWDKSSKGRTSDDGATTIEIDAIEESVQRRIAVNRTKLLWPGVWTFFALAGTYGAFAYLDARYVKGASSSETRPLDRIQLPQSWVLTPKLAWEGIKAGWTELDKLTIGIVIACIGVHLMKKSPLPFWENLIHITGEKRYTAFTYPFVHIDWAHLGTNMFVLCWFLPGVVRYLNDDHLHAAALLLSVPLITSYMQHFMFRFGPVTGLPLNLGSSGVAAAVIGAFCMVYPDEKVWLPFSGIFRLDAKYWGPLALFLQMASMLKSPKGGNRPADFVSSKSLAWYHG
jgi:membrane associated rhomboid family serine protease